MSFRTSCIICLQSMTHPASLRSHDRLLLEPDHLLADLTQLLLGVLVQRPGVGLHLLAVAVVLAAVGLDGVLEAAVERGLRALHHRLQEEGRDVVDGPEEPGGVPPPLLHVPRDVRLDRA